MNITTRKAPSKDHPNVKMLTVEGLDTAQRPNVVDMLKSIKEVPLIIEIGTCKGGFSLLLRNTYPDAIIFTWDIAEWQPTSKIITLLHNNNINRRIEDCFNSEELNYMLGGLDKKIVFCDGGLKAREFNRFSLLLNPGDIIGVHDYFPSKEDYDQNLWTCCEATEDMLITEGFDKIYEKESLPAVWGLFIKK